MPVAGLTREATRIQSLLFARAHTASPTGGGGEGLTDLAKRFGVRIDRLADGSMLVSAPADEVPTDQARRLARAAIALLSTPGGLAMALAAGRRHDGGIGRRASAAAERAGALLAVARSGEIRVDPELADALSVWFEVARRDDGAQIVDQRAHEAPRMLLGQPTPWVGRRRELAVLDATFDECAEEPGGRGDGRSGHGQDALAPGVLARARATGRGGDRARRAR